MLVVAEVVIRVHVPAERVEVESVAGGAEHDVGELVRDGPRLVVHEQETRVPSVAYELDARQRELAVRDALPRETRGGYLGGSVSEDPFARVVRDLLDRRTDQRADRGLERLVADVQRRAELAPVPGLEHPR